MKIPEFISQWLIKYWRWFAVGVVVIIFGLGYVTLLAGKISAVQSEGLAERSRVNDELKADENYQAALQASADAFAQKISTEDLTDLEQFIPTGSDFPTLLLTVKDIVQRSSLQLTDLFVTEIGQTVAAGTTAPVADAGSGAVAQAATIEGVNLRTQDIAVTVTGIRSYEDVKNLVRVIESSRRLFDIVSIGFELTNIAAGDQATGAGGSPINLRLRTYYLPSTQ